MKKYRIALMFVWGFIIFALVSNVFCQDQANAKVFTINAVEVNSPPEIDGKLNDPCWKKASKIDKFFIYSNNKVAKFKSVAYVCYDKKALYIAVKCFDPKVKNLKADIDVTEKDGKVWRDDCVEVMINPDNRPDLYYHFVSNSKGAKYDREVCQGGAVGSSAWNGEWKVKTSLGKNYWIAEMAFPYYGLGITKEVGNTWAINIAREKKTFPQEITSLSFDGVLHDANKFSKLKGVQVNFSKYAYKVSNLKLKTMLAESGTKASVLFRIVNQTAGMSRLKAEAWLIDADDIARIKSEPLFLQRDEEKKVVIKGFQLKKQGNYFLYLNLADEKTGEVYSFSKKKININFIPLDISITQPFYRDSIYATEKLDKVKVTVRTSLEEKRLKNLVLKAYLKEKDGKILEVREVKHIIPEIHLEFDASKLKIGDYSIDVKILNKKGEEQVALSRALHKLPPAPDKEVRIDKNQILLDGKPIFIFGGWVNYYAEDQPTEGINTGFNKKFKWTINYCGIAKMGKICKKPSLLESDKKVLKKMVESALKNPNLIGYFFLDEPGCKGLPPKTCAEAYEYIKKLDPYHPVFITSHSVKEYSIACDIDFPHKYPLFKEGGGPISPLWAQGTLMDFTRKAGKRLRPAGVCPQWFNYGDRGLTGNRGPNFKELRACVYFPVIHGAKMIMGYSGTCGGFNYPAIRVGVPFLAGEIKLLSPVILNGETEKVKAVKGKIDLMAKKYKGELYIFAANKSTKSSNAIISIPSLKAGKLWLVSEGRVLKVKKGRFEDFFTGNAVHIYTTSEKMKGKRTLKQVKNEISRVEKACYKKGNLAFKSTGAKIVSLNNKMSDGFLRFLHNGITDMNVPLKSPALLQVTLPGKEYVSKVVVYNPKNIKNIDIQLDGGKWISAKTDKSRHKSEIIITFEPIMVKKIQLRITTVNKKHGMSLSEIEVYGK